MFFRPLRAPPSDRSDAFEESNLSPRQASVAIFVLSSIWIGIRPSESRRRRNTSRLWRKEANSGPCESGRGEQQKMSETIQNGFGPLVALLTSQNVDAICAKNRLTFADLLAPFSVVSTSVKDPNGQSAKIKLRIDVRDVQRHGFLLTLTALPHVLREAVASVQHKAPDVWTSTYQDSLFSWFESAHHEFFKTYLCSMFVVSAHESNPLGELSRLVQLQYAQQHGSGESTSNLGPRHCADPKWFMPNILKYYVLVYDVSIGEDDDSAAQELFSSMCKTYSDKNCYFLKINSGEKGLNLPDPWSLCLESRYRGLEVGLASARKSLLLVKNDSIELPISPLSVSSHHSSEPRLLSSSISTVSSSVRGHSPIFSTSNHGLSIPNLSNSTLENGGVSMGPTQQPLPSPIMEASSPTTFFDFGGAHGQLLSAEDRRRIIDMMESLVNEAVVPFAQKQMRYLSENLNGRRGFSKSIFSGMRKWVGSSSTGQLGATPMTYSSESGEMQLRRLADMAFLFGLYSYAYPIYHALRKDFAADQAWLYHAGASEMAAISKFLSDEQTISFKDFPVHYLTSAMDYYMNTCGQNLLAVRCALVACNIYQVFAAKERNPEQNRTIYKDTSNFLIRLTSNQSDLESAVLLERASECFSQGELFRKMAFHYILAGHRFMKAGLREISLECYQKALPQIVERQWQFAEDHILYTIANDCTNTVISKHCAVSLMKPYSMQHPDQQAIFFRKMLQVLQASLLDGESANSEPFPVPVLDSSNIVTFHGGRYNRTDGTFVTEVWPDLQKPSYQHLKLVSSAMPTPRAYVCTNATDNRRPAVTPAFENFTVCIPLRNPLDIPLTLRKLRLATSEVVSRTDESCEIEASEIDELVIGPQKEVVAELSLKPTADISRMKISKLEFTLASDEFAVQGYIPLEIRGPRKSTPLTAAYEDDCRLDVHVAETRWPLLDMQLSHRSIQYCDQIVHCILTVTNIGSVDVDSICLATDRPDLVGLMGFADNGSVLKVTPTKLEDAESTVFLSQLHGMGLTVGSAKQIKLIVRAPPQAVESFLLRMLFVYVGTNGAFREHRECISLTTRAIFKAEARILAADTGVCCVDVQNTTSSRDSMIAKVEVQRIAVISRLAGEASQGRENFVYICPIRNRSLLLESEQRDSYCFTVSGKVASPAMESTELWLADQTLMDVLPAWSDYAFKAGKPRKSQIGHKSVRLGYLQLSILWKAQLVYSDGALSTVSIFGETPIQNPFISSDRRAQTSHRVPGTDPTLKFISERIDAGADEFTIEKPSPATISEAAIDVLSSVNLQSPSITHDFSVNRLCSFVVRLTVENVNPTLRDIWVTVNCGPIDSSTPFAAESSGVASILQAVAVATVSSQQALIPHQAKLRAKISHGSSHSFVIRLRATSPSVYDLTASIRASVSFDADSDAERALISVPLTYITILDSRASSGVRAAAALRV